MITYGSMFSGAGLLDTGLHRSLPSLRCAFAIALAAHDLALSIRRMDLGRALICAKDLGRTLSRYM